ncbi:MAG: hypothetical protein LBL39_02910 [Planctomycetaceae bacterium]|jgi:hypothetical protein|nr:hypothetical protein [Planctomycetaceae bacterium]
MDNPVQVQRSTGGCRLPQQNCVAVQLETFIFVERVELLRSSVSCGCVTPCCTPFARGYPY